MACGRHGVVWAGLAEHMVAMAVHMAAGRGAGRLRWGTWRALRLRGSRGSACGSHSRARGSHGVRMAVGRCALRSRRTARWPRWCAGRLAAHDGHGEACGGCGLGLGGRGGAHGSRDGACGGQWWPQGRVAVAAGCMAAVVVASRQRHRRDGAGRPAVHGPVAAWRVAVLLAVMAGRVAVMAMAAMGRCTAGAWQAQRCAVLELPCHGLARVESQSSVVVQGT